MHSLVAAGARSAPLPARRLPDHVTPLLSAQVKEAQLMLNKIFVPPMERRYVLYG